MAKVFIFDADRCNGCANCMLACKDEHCDNDWTPYAKPQQQTGQNWNRLDERERGQVPKVRVSYVLHLCQHCDDCALVAAAPECVYRRDDGLVIIDPEKAAGRRDLVELCPHGAVSWNAQLELPQKCTGCAHLLDDGWSVPRCVEVCAMGALRFGDEEEFADEIARGELLQTLTDELGDFWFKQIEPADYTVYFEKEGYLARKIDASTVEEDRNVGTIALYAEQV